MKSKRFAWRVALGFVGAVAFGGSASALAVSDDLFLFGPDGHVIGGIALYEDGTSSLGGPPTVNSFCSEGISTTGTNFCLLPFNVGDPDQALNGGAHPTIVYIDEQGSDTLSDIVFVFGVAPGVYYPFFESDTEGQDILAPNDPHNLHETGQPIGVFDVSFLLSPAALAAGDTLRFSSDVPLDEFPTPEPLTLSLFGAGLAGAVVMRRRKKRIG